MKLVGSRVAAIALVAGSVAMGGCSTSESTEERAQNPDRAPVRTKVAPRAVPPPARVRTVEGPDSRWQRGQPIVGGEWIETLAEKLTIDIRQGGRLEVLPQSKVLLEELAPSQWIVGRGRVRAMVAPTGNSPRPPMRLGTPAATFEIDHSGSIELEVRGDGIARVRVFSGAVQWISGEVDERGRVIKEPVVAGSVGVVDDQLRRSAMPEDSEADDDWSTQAIPRSSEARERTIASHEESLQTALSELEAERERGQVLEQAHREALGSDRTKAVAIQRDLVRHTQALHRLQQRAMVHFERVRATHALFSQPSDALEAWRTRLRTALGRP